MVEFPSEIIFAEECTKLLIKNIGEAMKNDKNESSDPSGIAAMGQEAEFDAVIREFFGEAAGAFTDTDPEDLLRERTREIVENIKLLADSTDGAVDEGQVKILLDLIGESVSELVAADGDASEETVTRFERQIGEALYSSLESKEKEQFRSLLAHLKGCPALFLAIDEGDIEFIREVVRVEGRSALEVEDSLLTPLLLSIVNKNQDISIELLRLGADTNNAPGNGMSPLMAACKLNNEALARILIEHGANPDFKGWQLRKNVAGDEIRIGNTTPIVLASGAGALGLVRALIEAGADVDTATEDGITPLTISIANHATEVALVLMESGACIDGDPPGPLKDPAWPCLNPFLTCVVKENFDMLRILVEKGVRVNVINGTGEGALHFASKSASEVMIKLLIDHGCDPGLSDHDGITPLHYACMRGSEGMVKMLLLAGADPKKATLESGITPLHIACQIGSTASVELLLDNGVDVNALSANGLTPLSTAIKYQKNDVASLLLKFGALVDVMPLWDVKNGSQKCLDPFLICVSAQNVEMLRVLIEKKVRKDGVTERGDSALKVASMLENGEMVKLLIDYGCDLDHSDNDGWTALQNAAGQGCFEVASMLLAAGADPNKATANVDLSEKGRTPLMDAVVDGYDEIVQLLLSYGASPGQKSASGSSAIHDAVLHDRISTARILIEKGANIDEIDQDGYSVLLWSLMKLTLSRDAGHEAEGEWSRFCWELVRRGADPMVRPPKKASRFFAICAINADDDIACSLIGKGVLEGLSIYDIKELLLSAVVSRREGVFQIIFEQYSSGLGVADLTVILGKALQNDCDAAVSVMLRIGRLERLESDFLITASDFAFEKGSQEIGMKLRAFANARSAANPTSGEEAQEETAVDKLILAAYGGDVEEVIDLLESGVDVNSLDGGGGLTVLGFCVVRLCTERLEPQLVRRLFEVIDVLVEHGAKVDVEGCVIAPLPMVSWDLSVPPTNGNIFNHLFYLIGEVLVKPRL